MWGRRGANPESGRLAVHERIAAGARANFALKGIFTARTAPRWMKWEMGYNIYADKVIFISHHEFFGFLIQSPDFSDLMRVQFELVWKSSNPLKGPLTARHLLRPGRKRR
jgi:hypothetical protein